jgi:hypothetical protein
MGEKRDLWQTVGDWKQGAEENIWAEERWSDRRLEESYIARSFVTYTLHQV